MYRARAIQRGLALTVVVMLLAMCASTMNVMGYTPLPVDDPIEPDPWIAGNVTKDTHKAAWDTFTYEDDVGAVKEETSFALADDVNEPYLVNYTKIYAPGVLQEVAMPSEVVACNSDKWNESDCWAQTDTAAGTGTIVNATVDGYGKALTFKHVGSASVMTWSLWTYDLTDVTTDVEKMRWIVGVRVKTLSAKTWAHVRVSDGTNANGYNVTSETASILDGYTQLGDSVGDAFFDDVMVNSLGTVPNTLAEITTIEVYLNDTDATAAGTVEISLLAMTYTTKRMMAGLDQDGVKVYNQTFATALNNVSVATFTPSFSYSRIGDLTVAFQQKASNLPTDSTSITDVGLDSGSYERQYTYRLDYYLPEAVDLTYADLAMYDELRVAGAQFESVLVGTDDKTSIYNAATREVGDKITLKATGIAADSTYTVKLIVDYTSSQYDDLSEPPGAMTTAGIWYNILGGLVLILGLVGLGAGLSRRRRAMRMRPPGTR